MDLFLALVILFPLLAWSGARLRRPGEPLPESWNVPLASGR